MTSLFSNAELLYSMPALGATLAGTSKTVVSGNSSTNPAYQMPPLQNLWPVHEMAGRSLRFVARGVSDATAVTNTLQLYFDVTQASTTSQILIAGTGAVTWINSTTGGWEFELDLSCVGVGNNTSTWVSGGELSVGVGNNAATTLTASSVPVGFANTAGVPATIALATQTGYFPELWSTWGTAPTAFVCTQFKVYAEN